MAYVLGEINCTFPATQSVDGVIPSADSLDCETPSYETMNLFAYGETGGGVVGNPPVVTINAMPYARTVAMGSITISGTATESPTSITWSASPSGLSGSFTPGASWSGSVSIPNGGVETITVTATNAFGSGNSSVTIGFYVSGAHSWFNAQSIDASYNSTLVNNDPITTWKNLGSSGLDAAQGTATAQPTYKTNVVGGQPLVSFDGGDSINCALTADWDFLVNDTTVSTHTVFSQTSDTNVIAGAWSTYAALTSNYVGIDCSSTNQRIVARTSRTMSASLISASLSPDTFNKLHYVDTTRNGVNSSGYVNQTATAFDTDAGNTGTGVGKPLSIGNGSGTTVVGLTGQIWSIIIYTDELSTAQREINSAVDAWALNSAFPVTL